MQAAHKECLVIVRIRHCIVYVCTHPRFRLDRERDQTQTPVTSQNTEAGTNSLRCQDERNSPRSARGRGPRYTSML